MAAIGLVRVVRNLRPIMERRTRLGNWLNLVRRISWTAIAHLILIFTAWRTWESADPDSIGYLAIVVFVLLIGMADASWEILVEVSRAAELAQLSRIDEGRRLESLQDLTAAAGAALVT